MTIEMKQYTAAEFAASLPVAPAAAPQDAQRFGMPRDSALSGDELFRPCESGGRTTQLTKIAGSLLGSGVALPNVVAIAGLWNARNPEPLDDDEVVRTCDGIRRTHERNHPAANADNLAGPLFPLEQATVHRFLETTAPPRRYLLQDCLPLGKAVALVAPGGSSKSQFALQLACSVATGMPLADTWQVGEQGGVLALFAEDDDDEIHRRLNQFVDTFASTHPSRLDDLRRNLHVKSMVAEVNLMTESDKNGRVGPTAYVERLAAVATQIPNLKLIIIDPVARFRGGVENSAEDTTRFVEAIEALVKATGATVLVIHHASKSSMTAEEKTQSAARGSSAFVDGMRWVMNISTFSEKQATERGLPAEERRYFLTAEITKNNYGPPQGPVYLQRSEYGILVRAELSATFKNDPQVLETAIIEVVKTEATAGRTYSKTSFEAAFGGEDGRFKIGKGTVRKTLTDMVKRGRLTESKHRLYVPVKAKPATAGVPKV